MSRAERGFQLLCGGIAEIVALGIFAIRFRHAGPYAPPEQGNLLAALILFALSALLFFPLTPPSEGLLRVRRIGLVALPLVLFFGLYAILAEVEEVVVLRGTSEASQAEPLRLWVVDDAGKTYVTMSRDKAERNALIGKPAELLRDGEARCVESQLVEAPDAVRQIFDLRNEKYAIARLAMAVGALGSAPSPDGVTLRLDPCPGSQSASKQPSR